MTIRSLILSLLLLPHFLCAQTIPDSIRVSIDRGDFSAAQASLRTLIALKETSAQARLDYAFEIERMDRIRKDFRRTETQVLSALKKYYPDLTSQGLRRFEADGSLEMMTIDGERRYFSNAVPNLFRINAEAKEHRITMEGKPEDRLASFLDSLAPALVAEHEKTGRRLLQPQKLTLTYTITVRPDAVPDGEIVRCWMPYPREAQERQSAVRLISMSEPQYLIAESNRLQRTLYAEKKAAKGAPTVFTMTVEYVCASDDYGAGGSPLVPGLTLSPDSVREFTSERPPHIVFTPEIRKLSQEIVGAERDPLKKARLIFSWISTHIPWASAREYSTIPNISSYCLATKHGDCGIKTLLFMTLARLNGIPAKWQSGWMLHPVEVNLHDWCEIFLDGYGWVPVDQSAGLRDAKDERVKYYYLGATDSYRFIVNDDYSREIYPAKIFPRSETVDFQRGELEWRGGNLYFDTWSYRMDVKYEPARP
ncbi:MAG: transglutaminase-like domain-containing protein [Acidobacteriota bacterium]